MPDTCQITFTVTPKVYESLARMAKGAGMAAGRYASLLFEAGYSARCKPTGDVDLDAAVKRVVLLWGGRAMDTAEIASAVRLSEPYVVAIIDAWKAERLGQEGP